MAKLGELKKTTYFNAMHITTRISKRIISSHGNVNKTSPEEHESFELFENLCKRTIMELMIAS